MQPHTPSQGFLFDATDLEGEAGQLGTGRDKTVTTVSRAAG